MDCSQKYTDISKKSFKSLIPKTEQKTRYRLSSLEFNLNNRYALTNEDLNNKQKLLDFISDKKKLSINSYFDQRGAKKFLNGKNEALKKIELDENLEETQIKNKKGEKKFKKKLNKMKSSAFLINKKNKDNNYINKDESINQNNKSKKKKAKSEKYLTNCMNNKLIDLKEKINDFDNDYKYKPTPNTHIHKHKKRKSKNKEIIFAKFIKEGNGGNYGQIEKR